MRVEPLFGTPRTVRGLRGGMVWDGSPRRAWGDVTWGEVTVCEALWVRRRVVLSNRKRGPLWKVSAQGW